MKPNLATCMAKAKTLTQLYWASEDPSSDEAEEINKHEKWVPLSALEEFGGALRQLFDEKLESLSTCGSYVTKSRRHWHKVEDGELYDFLWNLKKIVLGNAEASKK